MIDVMLQKVIDAKRDLILLSRTRRIQDADLVHPVWKALKDSYDSVDVNGYDPHLRAITSLVNAALTHNKIAFAVTRNKWQQIVRGDENYSTRKNEAFGSNYYKSILALAVESGLFEIKFEGKGRAPMGLVFVYETIVRHMTVNREEQVEELRAFLNKGAESFEQVVEKRIGREAPPSLPEEEHDTPEDPGDERESEPITFRQMLLNAFPRQDGVRFGMLKDILDTAVANGCDLDGSHRELGEHFFGDRKKPTPKMRKFRKEIEGRFLGMVEEHEAGKLKVTRPEPREARDVFEEHSETMIDAIVKRRKAKRNKG